MSASRSAAAVPDWFAGQPRQPDAPPTTFWKPTVPGVLFGRIERLDASMFGEYAVFLPAVLRVDTPDGRSEYFAPPEEVRLTLAAAGLHGTIHADDVGRYAYVVFKGYNARNPRMRDFVVQIAGPNPDITARLTKARDDARPGWPIYPRAPEASAPSTTAEDDAQDDLPF